MKSSMNETEIFVSLRLTCLRDEFDERDVVLPCLWFTGMFLRKLGCFSALCFSAFLFSEFERVPGNGIITFESELVGEKFDCLGRLC